MSASVTKPLKVAKLLPREASPKLLVAVPVRDDETTRVLPTVSIPAAEPPAQKALEPAAAAPKQTTQMPADAVAAKTHWGAVVGLGFWRLRLAFASGSISATVHGVAIIVLAVMSAAEPDVKRPPVRRLEVTMVHQAQKQELLPKFLPKAKLNVETSVSSVASATASGTGSAGSGGGRGGGSVGGLQLAGINPGKFNTASGGTGFGTDDAFGRDMLGEVGELADPTATFFGVKADGRKFAFVVDTSGSMRINARFLRCRNELLRSLSSMQYGQQYFVVFFNHSLYAMPEHKLVDARPSQLKKTSEWIIGAVPGGGTEPWPGLQLALRLKPDAIYLLTDGQFDPAVVDKVITSQRDSKKIPIHTIAFESPQGAVLLEAISRATGGQHQFVP